MDYIKEIGEMYKKVAFLNTDSIVEIYGELNELLKKLPKQDIRECFAQGVGEITFGMDGTITFTSVIGGRTVREFGDVDMSKIKSIDGMYAFSYIDLRFSEELLVFGFVNEYNSNGINSIIKNYKVEDLFEGCLIEDRELCIPLYLRR